MKRIVDNEVYKNEVSTYNKNLIKDFLIEKRAQGRANSTIEQYGWDLRIVAYLIYEHFDNKRFIDLTRKDIRNLAIILREMSMSNARVNSILSAFRSALEFCAEDDDYEYEFNVGSRVRGLPKNPVKEITFLTEEQIEWLIDELLLRKDYIVATYLSLSYYSCARKNEVYQVMKDDLVDRYFTNTVIGKRGKRFRLYYNDRVRECINLYLESRGKDTIPQLFVKVYKNGKRKVINRSTFNHWCVGLTKMLSDREGKEIKINPHCLRHSRLDNLKVQGVPLEKLKSLANHSDISTTESYLKDRSEEDIADIFNMDPKLFVA